MADVLVVGAGPVGLTMAIELARHGVRCRVIDRALAPSPFCRAIGVTQRTLEVFDDMGVAQDIADAGLWLQGMRSIVHGHPPIDIPAVALDVPFAPLGVPQYATETVLGRHLARRGVAIERGVTLAGLVQDADGVTATLAGPDAAPEEARFRYVIGCDGAHSTVRHALGIDFEGEAMPWPFMLGDVRIDWDLPYGMSFRALRLVEDGPPEMFLAIPLPEAGRYRVTMMAPADWAAASRTDHGIQSELTGPNLAQIQAIADALVPDAPTVSDLRWSSVFRISMRLATRYRDGRVFIAGDAAHIHPPTGGQGMNTGIQDAYNLGWKLGLVCGDAATESLLDSYEAERQPVGLDVIQRTLAASANFGREKGGAPDRLADAQISISYRQSALVRDEIPDAEGPRAGDRAPDIRGLRRQGFNFPLRLFDLLRGTDFVLLVRCSSGDSMDAVADMAANLRSRYRIPIRVMVVAADPLPQHPAVTIVHDAERGFDSAYGAQTGAVLVRPDGYLCWRGVRWDDPGLAAHLSASFATA